MRDPKSGDVMTASTGAEQGLLSLQTGEVIDPESGKPLAFEDAVKRGILLVSTATPPGAKSPESVDTEGEGQAAPATSEDDTKSPSDATNAEPVPTDLELAKEIEKLRKSLSPDIDDQSDKVVPEDREQSESPEEEIEREISGLQRNDL